MARVLVVGSGFAGLSAAARLAKLRHDVTVLERDAEPGGRLLGVEIEGRRWAVGPEVVTLPGVFRDLFRKSGRPIDALIELSPAGSRRHVLPGRWPRGTATIDLPFGTRGAQHHAVTAALGTDAWSPWLDGLTDAWNALRRDVLETAHDADAVPPVPLLEPTLARYVRAIRDPRLRRLAADVAGVDPARAPAVWSVWPYVERSFGHWSFAGGSAGLAAALLTRLRERKVTVETGVEAILAPDSGLLVDGEHRPAEVVVWAAGSDPLLPAPAPVRELTAVRLDGAALPDDLVVHGRHVVRAWASGDGWVLEAPTGVDPLDELARHGTDVRSCVTWRATVPAPPLATEVPRPARSPRPGLWLVGAAAVPGASLEVTGMGTAALAARLGAVPR